MPVRVRACQVKGLLGSIVHMDLVDQKEATAREALIAGVQRVWAKPSRQPFRGRFGIPSAPSMFSGTHWIAQKTRNHCQRWLGGFSAFFNADPQRGQTVCRCA